MTPRYFGHREVATPQYPKGWGVGSRPFEPNFLVWKPQLKDFERDKDDQGLFFDVINWPNWELYREFVCVHG